MRNDLVMSREKNVSFKAKCIEPREEKLEHLVDGEDAYVTVEKEVLRTFVKTELLNGVLHFTNENCDVKAMKHRAVVLFTQGNDEDRKWAMGVVKGCRGIALRLIRYSTKGVRASKEKF